MAPSYVGPSSDDNRAYLLFARVNNGRTTAAAVARVKGLSQPGPPPHSGTTHSLSIDGVQRVRPERC